VEYYQNKNALWFMSENSKVSCQLTAYFYDFPCKGFITLDQLHGHDWLARKFQPICKFSSEFTKDILFVVSEILSSG